MEGRSRSFFGGWGLRGFWGWGWEGGLEEARGGGWEGSWEGNGEGEARNFLVGGFAGIGWACVCGWSVMGQAVVVEEEGGARTIRKPPASSTPFTIQYNQ